MTQSLNSSPQKQKFSVAINSKMYQNLIASTLRDPARARRFTAAITSAVAVNPALQECDAGTILAGALLGESLNLSPSPQLGQYYLVPFKQKAKYDRDGNMVRPETTTATFVLGYKGYIQLALRSGQYKDLDVMVIKQGEYMGKDPETGKAIIKNVLGKTQAEVKEKLKRAIEENVGIDYGRAKNYTVGNWLEVWYENYAKIKMRPSTYLTYHGYIENHIKPQLGKIPLNDLTTLHLQQFYKKLLAEGRVERIEAQKQPKGLSAKTVRNIHQIISSALKLANEQRLIAHNPADGCALPKAERKEMQTLPVEQLTSFLREAKDSGVFALYYIDLTTGLRRGELLGLKWSDIDLEKGDLRVQRQIGRIDGKIIEMPLKTKNAYRTLPLSADAISVLKIQKCKVGNSEWVFPSPTGGPMSPDSVLHMLHRVLKRAGLPKVRFHDLRHTFATLALQNGVDIKTVSGMLGHFSAGFTLDTYAHVTTSAKREAAKTMGSILSGTV